MYLESVLCNKRGSHIMRGIKSILLSISLLNVYNNNKDISTLKNLCRVLLSWYHDRWVRVVRDETVKQIS